jgi:hypothetical protein
MCVSDINEYSDRCPVTFCFSCIISDVSDEHFESDRI